jgi:predicted nuclease with TOPRIM domain
MAVLRRGEYSGEAASDYWREKVARLADEKARLWIERDETRAEVERLRERLASERRQHAANIDREMRREAEVERLREALKQARYFVSKHDMRGNVLAVVDEALDA